jgi:type IV pilus biogenesis protein PilP
MSRHKLSILVLLAVAARAHGDDSGACGETEGAPPAGDCTEYMGMLELQSKRLKLQVEIENARQQIAEARKRRAEAANPAPAPAPAIAAAKIPLPSAPEIPDRVYEIFGEQARIRYRGGQYLVRQGQRLPDGGAWIARISSDGVTVAEGKARRILPFMVGDWR